MSSGKTQAFSRKLFFDADEDGDPDLFFTNRHASVASNVSTRHARRWGGGEHRPPALFLPGGCRCEDCRCHRPGRQFNRRR